MSAAMKRECGWLRYTGVFLVVVFRMHAHPKRITQSHLGFLRLCTKLILHDTFFFFAVAPTSSPLPPSTHHHPCFSVRFAFNLFSSVFPFCLCACVFVRCACATTSCPASLARGDVAVACAGVVCACVWLCVCVCV